MIMTPPPHERNLFVFFKKDAKLMYASASKKDTDASAVMQREYINAYQALSILLLNFGGSESKVI
jgi:hypothetical protein